MSVDVLIYPFLFIAIFFQAFLLVTFLSKPARASRQASATSSTPTVAVIVPCWNEESTVAKTVESLLALTYPAEKLSVILVDDGSTDSTRRVFERFAHIPNVTTVHKENGGKFSAMNLGLNYAADAELIGFLDADSSVAPDALSEIVSVFHNTDVKAVTASMSIHEPRTLIQRMQYAEYLLAITIRHTIASLNGLYVTPGPFSFYHRSVFAELGLFKHAHLAEDMEMAMRIQRAGYRIGNALRARVYTKGPPTFATLVKQRVRWTTGFLRNILFDYRDLVGSRKNSVLGMFVLPLAVTAIIGGISVFLISAVQTIDHVWHALTVAQVVPLSYTLAWRPVSWYALPITALALFGAALLGATLVWMVVGKKASRTPGKLATNAVVYLLLYSVVAPLWLIRSVADVARGARTTWR